jgi:hypothetical protein
MAQHAAAICGVNLHGLGHAFDAKRGTAKIVAHDSLHVAIA